MPLSLQMRFCKCARKIKDAIDAGKLGDLLHIDVLDKEYRDESYCRGPPGAFKYP
jgi:predicted dehydrogenase